jgi:hypothetical protein
MYHLFLVHRTSRLGARHMAAMLDGGPPMTLPERVATASDQGG